jgi:hypothetical protein
MLITSTDYTAAQHDTGAAEENQQHAKQLHEEQPERKSLPRPLIILPPSLPVLQNPNRPPTSRIPAVTCLASRSSFPMHCYKFISPKP